MTTTLEKTLSNLSDDEFNIAYKEMLDVEKKLKENLRNQRIAKHLSFKDEKFAKEYARENIIPFTRYTYADYDVNDHHDMIGEVLDKWVNKEIRFLILTMPPRHGKSELVSRRLPAKIFGKNPDARIIATSYGATLASDNNRDIQKIMDDPEYWALFPESRLFSKNIRTTAHGSFLRNSDVFEIVNHRGRYTSSGIGGTITGLGFDFGIIDDPVKNAQEALSSTLRETVWNWYKTTFVTRMEKNGSIIIILTRWHEDDLVGRILKEEGLIENGGKWTVMNFPAIKDTPITDNSYDFRYEGEVLWKRKYDEAALNDIKKLLGSFWFSALYQGKPTPEGGGIVNTSWFMKYEQLPSPSTWKRVVQSWDTAFKANKLNAYNACTTWIETDVGYYLWHVWRDRKPYPVIKKMIRELHEKFHSSIILIEDAASGPSLIADLKQMNLPIKAIPADTDKITRMSSASPTIEAGNVYIPDAEYIDAPWLSDYLMEIAAFPNAAFKDQCDSTSQAINFMKGNLFHLLFDVLDKMVNESEKKNAYEAVMTGDWKALSGIKDKYEEEVIPSGSNVYERVLAGMIQ